ncbi:hypothetical protein N5D52_19165 [Pseudomonas sp. GD03860]|uniref:hypothetical protein n=1 Tax=Pseudomonas sp. GD03860 TaxID=2975389 RepID=UPI00244BF6A7|nr:hypothetical protein [Pseudomonas sp. GD03860]MDH0639060.1 hypothetical protein [Pseudomonas sp. GD03860]
MTPTTQAALPKARPSTPAPVINRVMMLEGKRDATELVFGMRDELKLPGGLAKVIAKLRALAKGRPYSSAAGIALVIEAMEQGQ